MNLEAHIQKVVEEAVQATLGKVVEDLKPKKQEKGELLTTLQAGKIMACSSEYIRSLQDKGELSLVFLPGSKHRRVKKSEVLALIEKNTVQRMRK